MTYSLRRRTLATLVTLAIAAGACHRGTPIAPVIPPPPPLPAPSVSSQWLAQQTTTLAFVAENRPAAAESSLLSFARAFPRTPEGDRARWWRTLLRAEARTAGGDAAIAVAQIDSLLTDSIAIEVRTEAVLMRRSLNAIDSVRKAEIRRRTQSTQLATDRMDELKVARDSLAKLNAEIDRLRRRLKP